MPQGFTFEQSAAIGMAYLIAWAALVKAAQLQARENVLILGTTGAVGSAATRIAHKRGARVLGTVRKATDIPVVGQLPMDIWITLETTEVSKGVRQATEGKGADAVFDLVGGSCLKMSVRPCLARQAGGH